MFAEHLRKDQEAVILHKIFETIFNFLVSNQLKEN